MKDQCSTVVAGTSGNKMLCKFLVAVPVFCAAFIWGQQARADMYLCRSLSGTMEFTNVRNSTECKAVKLPTSQYVPGIRFVVEQNAGGSPDRYDSYIQQAARRYQVDPSLIKAIIHTESDFDHRAVSSKGAQGLMQLMPETARELQVADPFNAYQNIVGGTRYFRNMLDSFNGDLLMSLAAYNAGPGLVRRTGGIPRIPETLRYVNKVLKKYKYYKNSWSQLASLK